MSTGWWWGGRWGIELKATNAGCQPSQPAAEKRWLLRRECEGKQTEPGGCRNRSPTGSVRHTAAQSCGQLTLCTPPDATASTTIFSRPSLGVLTRPSRLRDAGKGGRGRGVAWAPPPAGPGARTPAQLPCPRLEKLLEPRAEKLPPPQRKHTAPSPPPQQQARTRNICKHDAARPPAPPLNEELQGVALGQQRLHIGCRGRGARPVLAAQPATDAQPCLRLPGHLAVP
jgi:hypothetical protein